MYNRPGLVLYVLCYATGTGTSAFYTICYCRERRPFDLKTLLLQSICTEPIADLMYGSTYLCSLYVACMYVFVLIQLLA